MSDTVSRRANSIIVYREQISFLQSWQWQNTQTNGLIGNNPDWTVQTC